MVETNLKALRAELKMTQEDFAHSVGVKLKTYRAAEWGKAVTNKTAQTILTGLNNLRIERGLSPLTIDDLSITLY